MAKISLIVNGNPVNANVDPRTLLVQFLRENLRLTGTHVGCDTSQCGACVVHLDGKAVKSCTTLAVMADGHEVKTIEGLAADGAPLHPMQEAFREHHGLQCGFCTPGMIMTAVDLVHRRGHDLSDHVIREELEGNLCRCTGYRRYCARLLAEGGLFSQAGLVSSADNSSYATHQAAGETLSGKPGGSPARCFAPKFMSPAIPTPSTYIHPSWKSNRCELNSELTIF